MLPHIRVANPLLGGSSSGVEPASRTESPSGSRNYESITREGLPGVRVSDPSELPEHLQHIFAAELGL